MMGNIKDTVVMTTSSQIKKNLTKIVNYTDLFSSLCPDRDIKCKPGKDGWLVWLRRVDGEVLFYKQDMG